MQCAAQQRSLASPMPSCSHRSSMVFPSKDSSIRGMGVSMCSRQPRISLSVSVRRSRRAGRGKLEATSCGQTVIYSYKLGIINDAEDLWWWTCPHLSARALLLVRLVPIVRLCLFICSHASASHWRCSAFWLRVQGQKPAAGPKAAQDRGSGFWQLWTIPGRALCCKRAPCTGNIPVSLSRRCQEAERRILPGPERFLWGAPGCESVHLAKGIRHCLWVKQPDVWIVSHYLFNCAAMRMPSIRRTEAAYPQ